MLPLTDMGKSNGRGVIIPIQEVGFAYKTVMRRCWIRSNVVALQAAGRIWAPAALRHYLGPSGQDEIARGIDIAQGRRRLCGALCILMQASGSMIMLSTNTHIRE